MTCEIFRKYEIWEQKKLLVPSVEAFLLVWQPLRVLSFFEKNGEVLLLCVRLKTQGVVKKYFLV
jgi:hypothetical protein